MKRIPFILLVLLPLAITSSQVSAGVSIRIGEPGFYGRLEIGNYPPPRLIYPEPIIVHRVATWSPPIYLRVPPEHVRHWHRHCNRYNACGRPVYFVEDGWYRDVYVPRYHKHPHPRGYAPPPVIRRPEYYEYRRYPSRPPKKIYIREYHRDDDHHRYDRHRHDHYRR